MEGNKKNGFPIFLLLIIVVLLIIGAAFGGTYLGNKYYEKELQKEIKEENVDKKDDEDEKKSEDKTTKQPEEEKIEIKYETEKMELASSKDKKRYFKHSRTYPTKISIDAAAEKKILDYMRKISDKEWESISKESKEMINDYEKGNAYLEEGPLGVEYSVGTMLANKSVISFNFVTTGGMGGVSWSEAKHYNFDTSTGDLLTLESVCSDVDTCKNTLFNYFVEELKKDERFNDLESDYEAGIKKNIYEVGGWGFTTEGLVLIVGKYEIADGANGIFSYIIPYNKVNSLLVEKYRQ